MSAGVWSFQAVDTLGAQVRGELEAPSLDAVNEQLRGRGLTVLRAVPKKSCASSAVTAPSWSASHPTRRFCAAPGGAARAAASVTITDTFVSGSPTTARVIRSTNPLSNASRTGSTTTNRLAAMQLWPELISRLDTHVSTADSRSASSRIT